MNKPIILIPPKTVPPEPSGHSYPEGLLDKQHGWLDPKGWYYPCSYGDHEGEAEVVHSLTIENCKLEKYMDTYSIILERNGWVKINCTSIFYPDHVKMDDAFPVTKEQFKFINDFLHHHKRDCLRCYDFRVKN